MGNSIRRKVLAGEPVCGTWLVLGSSLVAEIAGNAGFDWVLIDMEHGMGGTGSLLQQLQALQSTPAIPLVRPAWNDSVLIKRILDMGPAGIMVPQVSSAVDAERAAQAMQYPPRGVRGLTLYTRPAGYGALFEEYFREIDEELLCIVQIETEAGVEQADAIAAVDRVDVLFVGPYDLTVGMGIRGEFDHPRFQQALDRVLAACKRHGKAAGILTMGPAQAGIMLARGFTFIGMAGDAGILLEGMTSYTAGFRKCVEG